MRGATNTSAIARKLNPVKPNCIVMEYKELNITAPSNVQIVSVTATAANNVPV